MRARCSATADVQPVAALRWLAQYAVTGHRLLDRFRRFLMQSRLGHTSSLIDTIDDYVEQITGDRTALHAKSSSIGLGQR